MNSIYQQIAQLINTHAPEAGFVDLDKGQLDRPEDFDTLIPCVLVSAPETNWEDLRGGNQDGEGSIVVRWLFHLPTRTHPDDPLLSQSAEALKYADTIHEVVMRQPDVLRRTRTRRYHAANLPPNVYVVETTYAIRETYCRPVSSITKPPPTIETSFTIAPQTITHN